MEAGGDSEPAQATLARDWSELPLDALTSLWALCHSWLATVKGAFSVAVKENCRSGARDVLCAMVKEAVDRSSGQLEVFIGEEFVDDDLLKYIGGRIWRFKKFLDVQDVTVFTLQNCCHGAREGDWLLVLFHGSGKYMFQNVCSLQKL
ncbi:hypothetical protein SETIT_6G043400v2 [Setaria italica]|uniref:Uncharacterized protein n=1 Tax=Setaria italica TaxID=4555 RepID=A0A368RID1_SETIT|nr:hypothetical protein SETIT_6G043400v2 [Setaria italica]